MDPIGLGADFVWVLFVAGYSAPGSLDHAKLIPAPHCVYMRVDVCSLHREKCGACVRCYIRGILRSIKKPHPVHHSIRDFMRVFLTYIHTHARLHTFWDACFFAVSILSLQQFDTRSTQMSAPHGSNKGPTADTHKYINT